MGTRFNWGRAAGAGLSSAGRSLKANKQEQQAEEQRLAEIARLDQQYTQRQAAQAEQRRLEAEANFNRNHQYSIPGQEVSVPSSAFGMPGPMASIASGPAAVGQGPDLPATAMESLAWDKYQNPIDKIPYQYTEDGRANALAAEQAMADAGLGRYYDKPDVSVANEAALRDAGLGRYYEKPGTRNVDSLSDEGIDAAVLKEQKLMDAGLGRYYEPPSPEVEVLAVDHYGRPLDHYIGKEDIDAAVEDGFDWNGQKFVPTKPEKEEAEQGFGTPSAGDLSTMTKGAIGTSRPSNSGGRRRDEINPGALYTERMGNDGYGFDPLNIRDKFSAAASDSMQAGRSPKDPALAPQIFDGIDGDSLVAQTDEMLIPYNDMQEDWWRTVSEDHAGMVFDKESGVFKDERTALGADWLNKDESWSQLNFTKPGNPGYEAFKKVIAPMMSNTSKKGEAPNNGFGNIEMKVLAEHARKKDISLVKLIDDMDNLDDVSKSMAMIEVSNGEDMERFEVMGDGTVVGYIGETGYTE